MSIKNNYNHTRRACYLGFVSHAAINNFAPLLFLTFKEVYNIPIEKITLLVTVNFGIQLLVDFISATFADKIGYRNLIVAAHIFAAGGLVGLGILPEIMPDKYIGLLIAVVCYAMGGGIIEVLVSPIVEACPTDNKSANMSLLHSFYCWGHVFVVVISTLFFTVFGIKNWQILAFIWAILPIINAVYFSQVPINTLAESSGESMPVKKLVSTKLFWILLLLMMCSGASELAMSQWASAFAEAGLKVSKTAGDLAGPCLFAVLMGITRVFYSKFSEKINLRKFIIGSGFLCVAGYLLASLSPFPALALVGCALCGLSVGIMWPGMLSIASEKCPAGGTALFALLALGGDLGCSTGPTLVGMTAGLAGDNLKIGILTAIIFPALLILGLGLLMKRVKINE